MNKMKNAFPVLMEYLFVILFFGIACTVSIKILVSSYVKNDLANRKRLLLEYVTERIESETLDIGSFELDATLEVVEEGIYCIHVYEVNEEYPHLVSEVRYHDEVLFELPFAGGTK